MNQDRLDELPDRYAVAAKNFVSTVDQLRLAEANMVIEEPGEKSNAEWTAEDVKAEVNDDPGTSSPMGALEDTFADAKAWTPSRGGAGWRNTETGEVVRVETPDE